MLLDDQVTAVVSVSTSDMCCPHSAPTYMVHPSLPDLISEWHVVKLRVLPSPTPATPVYSVEKGRAGNGMWALLVTKITASLSDMSQMLYTN